MKMAQDSSPDRKASSLSAQTAAFSFWANRPLFPKWD
jgi:hypothetical protein